jgi:hypothetical protein
VIGDGRNGRVVDEQEELGEKGSPRCDGKPGTTVQSNGSVGVAGWATPTDSFDDREIRTRWEQGWMTRSERNEAVEDQGRSGRWWRSGRSGGVNKREWEGDEGRGEERRGDAIWATGKVNNQLGGWETSWALHCTAHLVGRESPGPLQ